MRLTFDISFKISEAILTPEELIVNYLFGLNITDKDGVAIPYETYSFFIAAAQQRVEKDFSIKFLPQIVKDNISFYRDDFIAWTFVRTTYFVNDCFSLNGWVGTTKQIEYPKEWISVNQEPSDLPFRQIHLIPATSASAQTSVVYSGITPHLGFHGYQMIPNYWIAVYCTGFKEVPQDLKHYIGQLAAIPVLDIGGSLVLGAGIANMSLGLDGLSQSIGTTSSAENHAYSSTIKSYQEQMKTSLPILEGTYKGIIAQTL